MKIVSTMPQPSALEILRKFYHMKVVSIARMDLKTIPVVESGTSLVDALRIIGKYRHVWVVDSLENLQLLGIVTEYDILRFLSELEPSCYSLGGAKFVSYLAAENVDDIMTRSLIVAVPDDYVKDALNRMRRYRVRYLPIVDENKKLLGELTLHEIILKFGNLLAGII